MSGLDHNSGVSGLWWSQQRSEWLLTITTEEWVAFDDQSKWMSGLDHNSGVSGLWWSQQRNEWLFMITTEEWVALEDQNRGVSGFDDHNRGVSGSWSKQGSEWLLMITTEEWVTLMITMFRGVSGLWWSQQKSQWPWSSEQWNEWPLMITTEEWVALMTTEDEWLAMMIPGDGWLDFDDTLHIYWGGSASECLDTQSTNKSLDTMCRSPNCMFYRLAILDIVSFSCSSLMSHLVTESAGAFYR